MIHLICVLATDFVKPSSLPRSPTHKPFLVFQDKVALWITYLWGKGSLLDPISPSHVKAERYLKTSTCEKLILSKNGERLFVEAHL
jgi:hypothetical protein